MKTCELISFNTEEQKKDTRKKRTFTGQYYDNGEKEYAKRRGRPS